MFWPGESAIIADDKAELIERIEALAHPLAPEELTSTGALCAPTDRQG
jgi:hypothetical protein